MSCNSNSCICSAPPTISPVVHSIQLLGDVRWVEHKCLKMTLECCLWWYMYYTVWKSVTAAAGPYTIEVIYDCTAVPCSPFTSMAYDSSAIKCGPVPLGFVDRPVEFNGRCRSTAAGTRISNSRLSYLFLYRLRQSISLQQYFKRLLETHLSVPIYLCMFVRRFSPL